MFHKVEKTILAFLFILTATTGVAKGSTCTPQADLFGVGDVRVSLIAPPAAPGVQSPTQTQRREHAYISSALANEFGSGVFAINPNLNGPNPQIRVWIQNPGTFKIGGDNRKSQAVFTVVGIVPDTRLRLWVYPQAPGTDPDPQSGELKLFASSDLRVAIRGVHAQDSNKDGFLDYLENGVSTDVKARVLVGAVGQTTFTRNTSTTTTKWYCEPDGIGYLRETARNMTSNQLTLLVPHGGAIETDTSRQIEPFRQVMETTYAVPVNYWNVEGEWKENQTFTRWHATTTALTGDAFPGLRQMLDQPKFDPAGNRAFRYALALHGFDSVTPHLIVGGRADRNARCLMAGTIRDAVLAAVPPPAGLIVEVPNGGGGSGHLDGDSVNNLVNRLAAEGGIQLEQSKGLRNWGPDTNGNGKVDNNEQILIDPIARAAAEAMGTWMRDGVSTTFCRDNGFGDNVN
jgi:phage replication-related protein YjqB (UPF0714/DUF867 family)